MTKFTQTDKASNTQQTEIQDKVSSRRISMIINLDGGAADSVDSNVSFDFEYR